MNTNEFAFWLRGYTAGIKYPPSEQEWKNIQSNLIEACMVYSDRSPFQDPTNLKIYADQFMKGGSSP